MKYLILIIGLMLLTGCQPTEQDLKEQKEEEQKKLCNEKGGIVVPVACMWTINSWECKFK